MPAASVLDRLIEGGVLFRSLRRFYRRRLTERGRFQAAAVLAAALVGVDTRRALVFVLFSLAAPPVLLALAQVVRRAPRLRFAGRLPERLMARRTATASLEIVGAERRALGPLSLGWGDPLPEGLSAACSHDYLDLPADRPARFTVRLRADRRGRFLLPPLGAASTDLFGLLRSRGHWLPERVLLAYPRYHTLDSLELPLGRRYQPGGIPLASQVGESLEFVGTREYREGDPPRKIHWRSWARLGRPVVREFQEEYFSRIALVLDTFLPRRPRRDESERFEAAISVLASVAEHFSRSEEVVDILAAGPDLYEVSTGRSLGYLDNVLDVLACLEPCPAVPFEAITPHLLERLERLTTVVAVMLDWDATREAFLQRVAALGVAVRVLLVHEGQTTRPWPAAGPVGDVRRIRPSEVEARLAAEESR